jgi:hypothetical protein
MAQKKPRKYGGKSRMKSKGSPKGKAGPSHPGNRVKSKGYPGGSSGPGLAHERYMTP